MKINPKLLLMMKANILTPKKSTLFKLTTLADPMEALMNNTI